MSLKELWQLAVTRKALILKIAAMILVLLALLLLLWPARYASSAVILLEPRKNTVTDMSAVLSPTSTDPASVQNQIQILTSRALAGQVVDQLQLARDPAFAKGKAADLRDMAIDRLLDNLSADAVGLSTTFRVTYTSDNPTKAAQIANALARAYVESQIHSQNEASQSTSKWLMERIQRLAQQIQASEEAVQRYKAENNLSDSAGGSIIVQQMAALSAQLITARTDLAQKQATANRVQDLMRQGRAADISLVSASPFIGDLRNQEAEVARQEAELATRYGSKHPKLLEVQNQRKRLEDKIAQDIQRVAETASNEAAVARAQTAALENNLHDLEGRAARENLARVKLKSLEANTASTQSMYQAFVSRLRATQDASLERAPDARVISAASISKSSTGPRRLVLMAAALPASLLLGLLGALLVERAQTGGLPVVGRLPPLERRWSDEAVDAPGSAASAALRAVTNSLLTRSEGKVVLLVNVLSAGQADLALGLARMAASAGRRVILMDGDLHGADATALQGKASLSQAFIRDKRSTVLLLNGGHLHLQQLRQACDLILIEAGANKQDMLHWARMSDLSLIIAPQTETQARVAVAAELSTATHNIAHLELGHIT